MMSRQRNAQRARLHPFLKALLTRAPLPAVLDEEWSILLQEIDAHRFAPLVYERLAQTDRLHFMPPSYQHRLREAVARITARHLAIQHELGALLRACHDRHLACVPLRGPVLSAHLHGPALARPMGDLDLLIHKEQLNGALALLTELGYTLVDRRRHFARDFSYTLELFKSTPVHVILEPHWSLAYPPWTDRMDMVAVWSRCRLARWHDDEILQLSPEDTLIHHGLHLVHRGASSPLLWVYELDQILRQSPRFNWDLVLIMTSSLGLTARVAEWLLLSRALFATPLPATVLDTLHAAQESESMRKVETGEGVALFLALKGVRRRWRYAWGLACPSPSFMRAHYQLRSGRWLWWWYGRRAGWLAWESLRAVIRMVIGNARRRSPSGV